MLTAFPYARQVKPVENAVERPHRDDVHPERPQQLGGERSEAAHDRRAGAAGPRQGRRAGPGLARGRGRRRRSAARRRRRRRSRTPDQPNKPESRLVVDRRLRLRHQQRSLGIGGNRDLFLNIVNWLAQQENLISVRPRDPQDRRITLSAGQDRFIFWLTVLIIPGLILLGGVQTWWRRR